MEIAAIGTAASSQQQQLDRFVEEPKDLREIQRTRITHATAALYIISWHYGTMYSWHVLGPWFSSDSPSNRSRQSCSSR